jgi:hypothetical protein
MYYTASLCSTNFLTNELNRRVGVATSLSPITPFTDSGKPVTQDWYENPKNKKKKHRNKKRIK